MPSTRQYTYARSADQPYAIEMLPLPDAEKTALLAEARAAYRKLFSAMAIAKNGSNATVVAGLSGVTTTKSIMICTTTTVYGSLEEVAALYVTDNTSIVLDFAESKRLYTLEAPSKHAPMRYGGVRWSRWKSPSKLVTDRDLLYVEFMDAFVDPDTGRRGWARCTKSIVHPCCPESQHPYGPVRAEVFCSGMILRETDAFGALEVSTLVHIDTQGVPTFIAQKVLNSRKKTAVNVNHVLKLMRQMNGDAVEDGALDAHDDRKCHSCSDHISKWTRARHCRHCDELLCKKCALISYVNSGLAGKTTRMCIDCGSGKRVEMQAATAAAIAAEASSTHSLSAPHPANTGSRRHAAEVFVSTMSMRKGSSRSIDTESVTSTPDDGDAALELLNELHLRESSKDAAAPILKRQTSRPQSRRLDHQHSSSSSSSSSTAASFQRPNPRERGASLFNEAAQKRRDAPVDLSYLNDLVSTKAK